MAASRGGANCAFLPNLEFKKSKTAGGGKKEIYQLLIMTTNTQQTLLIKDLNMMDFCKDKI
jgi:hypothetical protein